VRLVLTRAALNKPALTTAIDFYVDSGTGEWLIPRCLPCLVMAYERLACCACMTQLLISLVQHFKCMLIMQ
jgi:hypothetical protein